MVSIIVLVHNKPEQTRACLESLLASADADWELVAVDNGSDAETVNLLREMADKYEKTGRGFVLLRNEVNAGAATGRNQAMAAASGDVFVFCDNDIIVGDEHWLSVMRGTLEAEESTGIVVCRLVFAWNTRMIQCAGCAVSPTGRVQFMGRGEAADDARFARRREVQCGISACMMVKRSLVDEIGGLDEAFNPVQFEDIDFCYRAREHGYRVVYEPAVTMLHDESSTTAGTTSLNNRYIVIKHGMMFKQRWRHMFEHENGPADSEITWKPIGRFAQDTTEDKE
jgi:GT2 family glycosyltransferase